MKKSLLALSILVISSNALASASDRASLGHERAETTPTTQTNSVDTDSSGIKGFSISVGYARLNAEGPEKALNGIAVQFDQVVNPYVTLNTGITYTSGSQTAETPFYNGSSYQSYSAKYDISAFETNFDLKLGSDVAADENLVLHPYLLGGGVISSAEVSGKGMTVLNTSFGGEFGAGLNVAIQKNLVVDASYKEQRIEGTSNQLLMTTVGYKF
ncbi:outer membrane beta-barrel protein [Vibrio breoganii]|nr:outer membrane beta-barrel protein [Vibrio breoganii]